MPTKTTAGCGLKKDGTSWTIEPTAFFCAAEFESRAAPRDDDVVDTNADDDDDEDDNADDADDEDDENDDEEDEEDEENEEDE